MTDQYYFDTDCLSAFLWVRGESILAKLFSGRIILPVQVYGELARVPHLLSRVDVMKQNGDLRVESMEADSKEYLDYIRMTSAPETGARIIGSGEAAGIAMVKHRGGTLASNNLRDVRLYVERYGLNHITTGDILVMAMNAGFLTEAEGNVIWAEMLRKRRLLPAASFSAYLKRLTTADI